MKKVFVILLVGIYSVSFAQKIESIEIKMDEKINKKSSSIMSDLISKLDESNIEYKLVQSISNCICIAKEKRFVFIRSISNNQIHSVRYSVEIIVLSTINNQTVNLDKLYDSYSDLTFKYLRKGIKTEDQINKHLPETINNFTVEKLESLEIHDLNEVLKYCKKMIMLGSKI